MDITEQCKERIATVRRRGREAELHRREVRERKEREKCEREITLKLDKEKAGIKYWKEKFSKMAEIRGSREHIIRIERGRELSVNKPTDSTSDIRQVKSKLTEGQTRVKGRELLTRGTELHTESGTKRELEPERVTYKIGVTKPNKKKGGEMRVMRGIEIDKGERKIRDTKEVSASNEVRVMKDYEGEKGEGEERVTGEIAVIEVTEIDLGDTPKARVPKDNMSEIERVTSERKEGELYEAEEIENEVLLLYEADKMLRLEKIRNNNRELRELNQEEQKLRLKAQGERKREWILKREEKSKLRLVQSLMRGIIWAGVDTSVKNFDMSESIQDRENRESERN